MPQQLSTSQRNGAQGVGGGPKSLYSVDKESGDVADCHPRHLNQYFNSSLTQSVMFLFICDVIRVGVAHI